MIPYTLSSAWASIAPALADHLWQSTLCVAAIGLLTFPLRKNQARVRYGLWLAASIKFLIPFSWLIAIGNYLTWRRSAPPAASSVYFTIEEIGQPFSQRGIAVVPAAPGVSSISIHWLPAILAVIWLCGFVAVLIAWCLRWRSISAEIRSAIPVHEGREVEALRRLEPIAGIRQRIQLLLSRTSLEPGIFGMSRPVLVWPHGISERLETPQLEAVLAHELWHVRRRDNLAALLHMIVEAIFWFHPLVWWLGARLIDERERACDEEVLELGSERHVYAESILKVCEFCVGSPLACVSGVTGADLKKRMVHIMSEHVVRKLDFTRKLLLSLVAAVAITAPVVFGLVHAAPIHAQSQSDASSVIADVPGSVSIKPSEPSAEMPAYAGTKNRMVKMMYSPDGFSAFNVTLRSLIQEAYGVQANQIVDGPDWSRLGTYDVEAKLNHPVDPSMSLDQRRDQMESLLQSVLADRAGLKLHREKRSIASYELVVAEDGSKLQASPFANNSTGAGGMRTEDRSIFQRAKIGPDDRPVGGQRMLMESNGGQVVGIGAQGVSTDSIARQLAMMLGTPVVNKTGLDGNYDFNLHWTQDANPASDAAPAAGPGSSLFNAIHDQLGLKLEPQNAPMDVLVIDHVEKPVADQ